MLMEYFLYFYENFVWLHLGTDVVVFVEFTVVFHDFFRLAFVSCKSFLYAVDVIV